VRAPDELVELDEPGSGDHLTEGWLALLDETGVSDYCATPDWALSWWETTGRRGPALVAVWYDGDGATEALVPLFRHREPLHHLVPIQLSSWTNLGGGRGNADHLVLPSRPERWPDVDHWLRLTTARRPLHLRSIDPDGLLPTGRRLLPPLVTEHLTCPRLDISGLDPVPAAYRKRLTYYRRRLERDGVELEVVGPATADRAQFDVLFDLHEARWMAASGVRPTHLRERADFFAQLVRRGTDARGPVLVMAHHDGAVVGVLLGFRFGTTFSYFQNGWDPRFADRNLGSVLVDEALSRARATNATVFDFMRGASEFKYRFGATDRIDRSVLHPSGPAGLLLRTKYSLARRR
jgi:CelD/BcsL family acetyltransferase involved in cellulose biosynthesis